MNEQQRKEVIKNLKVDTGTCCICGKSDHIEKLEYVRKEKRIIWFHKKCLKDW